MQVHIYIHINHHSINVYLIIVFDCCHIIGPILERSSHFTKKQEKGKEVKEGSLAFAGKRKASIVVVNKKSRQVIGSKLMRHISEKNLSEENASGAVEAEDDEDI